MLDGLTGVHDILPTITHISNTKLFAKIEDDWWFLPPFTNSPIGSYSLIEARNWSQSMEAWSLPNSTSDCRVQKRTRSAVRSFIFIFFIFFFKNRSWTFTYDLQWISFMTHTSFSHCIFHSPRGGKLHQRRRCLCGEVIDPDCHMHCPRWIGMWGGKWKTSCSTLETEYDGA